MLGFVRSIEKVWRKPKQTNDLYAQAITRSVFKTKLRDFDAHKGAQSVLLLPQRLRYGTTFKGNKLMFR